MNGAQKPSLGRIVHVEFLDGRTFNGSAVMPAIVTANFGGGSPEHVNVRVMTDSSEAPLWLTSIARKDLVPEGLRPPAVWFWPPRD